MYCMFLCPMLILQLVLMALKNLVHILMVPINYMLLYPCYTTLVLILFFYNDMSIHKDEKLCLCNSINNKVMALIKFLVKIWTGPKDHALFIKEHKSVWLGNSISTCMYLSGQSVSISITALHLGHTLERSNIINVARGSLTSASSVLNVISSYAVNNPFSFVLEGIIAV